MNYNEGSTLDDGIKTKLTKIYLTRALIQFSSLLVLFIIFVLTFIYEYLAEHYILWPVVIFALGLLLWMYCILKSFAIRKLLLNTNRFLWSNKIVDSVEIFSGVRSTIKTVVYCEHQQFKLFQSVFRFKKGDEVLCIIFQTKGVSENVLIANSHNAIKLD